MRVSKILLRWYKSFNVSYVGYGGTQRRGDKAWNNHAGTRFPFIEIPIDKQITTLVGANETGKSHLLSAIAKIFTGKGVAEEAEQTYGKKDICRYCAFGKLEDDIWPNLGLELSFESMEEYESFAKLIGIEVGADTRKQTKPGHALTIILDGSSLTSGFAQVYAEQGAALKNIPKSKWDQIREETAPSVHFIDARVALSNEVHINQLLQMYTEETPGPVYEPLALQNLADAMLDLKLKKGQAANNALLKAYEECCKKVKTHEIGLREGGTLEALLFRDVLGIPRVVFEEMAKYTSTERGYVDHLVAGINHKLNEVLHISNYWEQDEEFGLGVHYKAGCLYFNITDKTEATYTFNERSSGLRYFLSYYIQAKAIEMGNEKRGAIVLMDEPDSFLSVVGQKNLLKVFESLVDPKVASGTCQVAYTTHSPFLINRNFPHRIRLLRKGDGPEGTQFIANAQIRRYEPIRSALGIGCAETLFMGSNNIIVEGISDQKLLTSAIQKFADPADIDRFLDLNEVTFVSAGGAAYVSRLLQASIVGDEKKPIVVVLLDSDEEGLHAYERLTTHNKRETPLEKDFITTIRDIPLQGDWVRSHTVMEDVVPPPLLALAVRRYLSDWWNIEKPMEELQKSLLSGDHGDTMAQRIERITTQNLGMDSNKSSFRGVRRAVIDSLGDCLFDDRNSIPTSDLELFRSNILSICSKLRDMLDEANRRVRKETLHKCFRIVVEGFLKTHKRRATRQDIERCLDRLTHECGEASEEARSATLNLNRLREWLHNETRSASAQVNIKKWRDRLKRLSEYPWQEFTDNHEPAATKEGGEQPVSST